MTDGHALIMRDRGYLDSDTLHDEGISMEKIDDCTKLAEALEHASLGARPKVPKSYTCKNCGAYMQFDRCPCCGLSK